MTGSTKSRTAGQLAFAVYLFVLVEIAARLCLVIAEGGEFLRPETILFEHYPQLEVLEQTRVDRDDGYFNILFLGGSVLHPNWGKMAELLPSKLSDSIDQKVRVLNLADLAQTSLDSYYKYKNLADKHFDLVFVYHGINEVRANNVPDAAFRDDYSHYGWYRSINLIDRHSELKYVATPYVIAKAFRSLRDLISPPTLLSGGVPNAASTQYGASIKTAAPLAANLRKIVELARSRDEPIVLSTFAFYLAPGYDLARFKAKSLDYGRHRSWVEAWGEPPNVVAGLKAHNEAIKDLAKATRVPIVDMAGSMPRDGSHFDDICHLTATGSERFADELVPYVNQVVAQSEPR